MVTSLENGSGSMENGRSAGVEVQTWPEMSESGADKEGALDPDLGSLHSNSNLNGYLAVQENRQLPSPSATPSPRSTSPALLVTDSSTEYPNSLSGVPNGRRYSGSSEKALKTVLSPQENDQVILASPLPISKILPPHELHDIPEERARKPRKLSTAKANGEILKLSAAEMEELTSAPESLPVLSPARLPVRSPSIGPFSMLNRNGSVSDFLAQIQTKQCWWPPHN